MKIIARKNVEDCGLVESLKQRGISAKLVRGAIIVELPEKPKEKWDEPTVYEIPVEVLDATFCIDLSENGGGMTNTGSGTIVCGLSGKALRPYYTPKGYSNSDHAYFSVPSAVVTITGYRKDENIKIIEHRIVLKDNSARIDSRKLWSGEVEALPNLFSRFQAAAEAAAKKGNCYHCRCVHYAV